jgi:O-acetylhomoserine (thiol)-lyase
MRIERGFRPAGRRCALIVNRSPTTRRFGYVSEPIAIHAGHDVDPTTTPPPVAVPIYRAVAQAVDSAEHREALSNLKVEGQRYGRTSKPTNRGPEPCVPAFATASCHVLRNLTQNGRYLVLLRQLDGTAHTLFAHFLPRLRITVKFAERDDDTAALKAKGDCDIEPRSCESMGGPAGNSCDAVALAQVADGNKEL